MKLNIQLFAVPFRKVSKTRKRMRRTHYKLEASGMTKCPKCGAMIRPHRVCGVCGYYKGKVAVSKEEKVVEKTPAKKKVKKAEVKEKKEVKKTTKKETKKA